MPRNNATSTAMLMMIVAMLALPGIDAIAKWLAGSVSSGQVTWSRFFFQIILMTPLLLRTRGKWLTPTLWLHAARGAMIAFAGYHRLLAGESEPNVIRAQPRWPLDTLMTTPG